MIASSYHNNVNSVDEAEVICTVYVFMDCSY